MRAKPKKCANPAIQPRRNAQFARGAEGAEKNQGGSDPRRAFNVELWEGQTKYDAAGRGQKAAGQTRPVYRPQFQFTKNRSDARIVA